MIRVIRAAALRMREAGRGSVICLSSIMGVAYGWDEHVHYSAAKAGVVGLVRGLAVELARSGVRVNGVAPGYVRTAQALSEEHSLGPAGLEKAAEFIPMGRVGEADDIADVIVFLASDAARYLTGHVVTVDGGLLVGRY
jgi:3-oxoacyl-[acyl-carrier protein] reductase